VGATAPANVGDAVAAWRDEAAPTLIATQATAGRVPAADATGLSFDGGDWLEAADRDEYRQRPGYTVAVWFARASAAFGGIVARDANLTGQREWGLFSLSDGRVQIEIFRSNGTALTLNSVATTTIDTFGLAAITLDAATVPRLYVNDAAALTAAALSTLASVATPLRIGSRATSSFNGSIGSVRIWHRALSAVEIAALWTAERGIYGV
jgi:hypothetical protein